MSSSLKSIIIGATMYGRQLMSNFFDQGSEFTTDSNKPDLLIDKKDPETGITTHFKNGVEIGSSVVAERNQKSVSSSDLKKVVVQRLN